jgi:hypothetical protein
MTLITHEIDPDADTVITLKTIFVPPLEQKEDPPSTEDAAIDRYAGLSKSQKRKLQMKEKAIDRERSQATGK